MEAKLGTKLVEEKLTAELEAILEYNHGTKVEAIVQEKLSDKLE